MKQRHSRVDLRGPEKRIIFRFGWSDLIFAFVLTRRFGLWTAARLCLRGFAPSSVIDDFEEFAPVLVILTFGE